jgi:hypothetical protein
MPFSAEKARSITRAEKNSASVTFQPNELWRADPTELVSVGESGWTAKTLQVPAVFRPSRLGPPPAARAERDEGLLGAPG